MKALLEIFNDRIITENIDEKYQTDALGRIKGNATAVVFPKTTAEVSKIMSYAHENQINITPRGAGTNLVGSTVPQNGGIVVDTSLMNNILEIDNETMTATVEPGVMLDDFQSVVEEKGFFYPPDPGEKKSSIGGNISTNAGGMRAVKYGVTRNYVRGLEIVLADGKVLNIGGKQVKDASGLSLKELIIGAEGTLAIITKCILKIIPKPQTTVSVLVPYKDLNQGIRSVLQILQSSSQPTAVEFMERSVVELCEKFLGVEYPCKEAGSYILLTFDGSKSEVEKNIEVIKELSKKTGATDFIVLETAKEIENIWKLRCSLATAIESHSSQIPLDMVVPINKISELIEFVKILEKESGITMIGFGHAGDGNVHLSVLEENHSEEKLKKVMEKAYHKAYELGGVTSGEHGIGVAKRHYFHKETNENNIFVMNQIKNSLDPKHILNDGKSYIR